MMPKKLWCREFFIYKLDFCPLSSSQWRLKRMRPVQQKSPPPPCCQPIVAIVTWTMSTKAQLLWGDGGGFTLAHDAIFFSGIRPLALFKFFVWSSVPGFHQWSRYFAWPNGSMQDALQNRGASSETVAYPTKMGSQPERCTYISHHSRYSSW